MQGRNCACMLEPTTSRTGFDSFNAPDHATEHSCAVPPDAPRAGRLWTRSGGNNSGQPVKAPEADEGPFRKWISDVSVWIFRSSPFPVHCRCFFWLGESRLPFVSPLSACEKQNLCLERLRCRRVDLQDPWDLPPIRRHKPSGCSVGTWGIRIRSLLQRQTIRRICLRHSYPRPECSNRDDCLNEHKPYLQL